MPPNSKVFSPDLVYELIEDYFHLVKAEQVHPTPAGLALHLDYDTTTQLLTTAKNDPPDPSIPDATITYLRRACTRLEKYYTENGLADTLPAAFTKFMLSVYLDLNEKQTQKIEHDQTITIEWTEPQALPSPLEAPLEVIEVKQLDHDPEEVDLYG